MKHILAIIVLLCAGVCQGHEAILHALDAAVVDAPRYHELRRARIDSARHGHSADTELRLCHMYVDFDTDSALLHLQRADSIAGIITPASTLQRIELYNSSLLMYKEAHELFESLDRSLLNDSLLMQYYTLGVQIYRNLEEMSADGAAKKSYAALKSAYRDSVLTLNPDATIILANKYADEGNYNKAAELMEKGLRNAPYSARNGAAYHVVAGIYGKQGRTDMQLEYLALAATADIHTGVREYLALPQLAAMLYERGDHERAYRYMRRSIDDATACKARSRMLEVSQVMPFIESAYTNRLLASRRWLTLTLLIAVALLGVLAASLAYARRRARQLHEARQREAEVNASLQRANEIKERYVTRFMNLSLDYLNKMDSYRAMLFKKAAARNFDILYDAISSTRYIDTEVTDFYRKFDEAFLELFPDFTDDLNCLLLPEYQIRLKNGNALTTELRVLALMKLGITDGDLIARFLRCSQSTVYNYRTRMRNRAVDRAKFEEFFN